MGTLGELRAEFGDEFFTRKTAAGPTHNWHELCVCGHLDKYHATSTGGAYRVPEPTVKISRGVEWTQVVSFTGCVGALRPRGFQESTESADRETLVTTMTVHPTCPCTSFTPVARIDRPNRYTNQRIPVDRSDRSRHPFVLGLKAFSTHLSRRRAALADPTWPDREFERRFEWLPGKRVCGISKCQATDAVWPVFVHDDRSELRCPAHR